MRSPYNEYHLNERGNKVLSDGSEVRYDLPLYRQIVEAPNTRIFSKAVKWLVESVLYKVFLPIEVREEFVNDITELFYQKFGYITSLDSSLQNSLSEYYLQEDVKVMPNYQVRLPNCNFLEYPFEGARMRLRNASAPYRFEFPSEYPNLGKAPDGGAFVGIPETDDLSRVEEAIDVKLAFELADLTKQEQDIVWLNSVVGMSLRDIADLSEEFPSKSELSRRLTKAKEKLKKALEDYNLK